MVVYQERPESARKSASNRLLNACNFLSQTSRQIFYEARWSCKYVAPAHSTHGEVSSTIDVGGKATPSVCDGLRSW